MELPPVLRRDVRRLARRPLVWIFGAVSLALAAGIPPGEGPILMIVIALASGMLFDASRALPTEREARTLDLLLATPLAPVSVLWQMALAPAVVWLTVGLVPMLIQGLGSGAAATIALEGSAIALVLGTIATMNSLSTHRSIERYALGMTLSAAIFLALATGCRKACGYLPPLAGSTAILAMGVAAWFALYGVWGGKDGLLEAGPATEPPPGGDSFFKVMSYSGRLPWLAPVPDAVSPIFWRNLHRGLGTSLMLAGLGALIGVPIFYDSTPACAWLMAFIAGALPGGFVISLAAWSFIDSDREAGVLDDLEAAPGQAGALIGGTVGATVILALIAFLPWMVLAAVIGRTSLGAMTPHVTLAVLFVVLAWTMESLAGAIGGVRPVGWHTLLLVPGLLASVAAVLAPVYLASTGPRRGLDPVGVWGYLPGPLLTAGALCLGAVAVWVLFRAALVAAGRTQHTSGW